MTYEIELNYNVILIPLINNIKNYNEEIDTIPFYANIKKEGVVIMQKHILETG